MGSPPLPPGTGPLAISGAVAKTPDYKAVPGGGKKDRHPCPDSGATHDWECGVTSCADCWDPPCEDNRKKEQDSYDEQQAPAPRTREQRTEDYKKANNDKIAAGHDPVGFTFENNTIDKVGADNIEYVGYAAHCKKCHVRAEVDVVTTDSVIECKNSAKGFSLDQMKENIVPIAQKCFPGKKIKCATRSTELWKLEKKVAAKEWKTLAKDPLEAMDP
jgi:hypothetical protein